MVRALWFGLAAILWAFASPAAAKTHLFDDEAPLKIVITAPFPELIRNDKTPKPYPASLTVTDGDAPAQTLAIQVTARGISRRIGGICSFPPIWLMFDKSTSRETIFKGEKKLKLVTYCRPPADYEQRIRLEYLAYKLYNLVTPVSLRPRAAEVTYRTSQGDAGLTRFGYILEDINDVAARNGLQKLKFTTHQLSVRQLDPHATARAALFEFMISNLDWEFLAASAGVECCHNTRLLAQPDATSATATAVVPVPYDFDQSGFVDAPYALPPEGIPVDSVTERFYRGYCISTEEIPSVVEEYRSHRAEMMALINDDPFLTPAFKDKTARYMESFFALLDDPARVQRAIVEHCR